jgi:aspartate/glutamate racemase
MGILGGMSPESTTLYYDHITRTYTAQYGDYGYPEILDLQPELPEVRGLAAQRAMI